MSGDNFFKRVLKLNSGNQAALKHSAGIMLNDADGKAFTAFYQAFPPSDEYDNKIEEKYFLTACIQCLWKPEDLSKAIPIEKALSKLIRNGESNKDTLLRRVQALINVSWDSYMAAKIYRLIKLCRSKGYVIDCEMLAQDLKNWNRRDKRVQKKWVCEICNTKNILDETKGENTNVN